MNEIIIFGAKYLYIVSILVGVVIIFISKKDRLNLIKLAILSLPLALVVGKIVNKLYYNPRPFVVEHVNPLIPHEADNGFPSDHTLLVMTIAAVVFRYNRRAGTILFVLGGLVGISRILAKVHHLTDVLGSTLISIVAVYVALYLIRRVRGLDNLLNSLLSKLA